MKNWTEWGITNRKEKKPKPGAHHLSIYRIDVLTQLPGIDTSRSERRKKKGKRTWTTSKEEQCLTLNNWPFRVQQCHSTPRHREVYPKKRNSQEIGMVQKEKNKKRQNHPFGRKHKPIFASRQTDFWNQGEWKPRNFGNPKEKNNNRSFKKADP